MPNFLFADNPVGGGFDLTPSLVRRLFHDSYRKHYRQGAMDSNFDRGLGQFVRCGDWLSPPNNCFAVAGQTA